MRETGTDYSTVTLRQKPLAKKLIQAWKKYQKDGSKSQDQFLKTSIDMCKLIQDARRADKKYTKIVKPYCQKLAKAEKEIRKYCKIGN